jgi:glycosyltransferase involved in cell wall biosynthesis
VILWASLWAQPRTPAHALGYAALRRLYSSADAVVTYGPHVSAYVRARGAGNVHVAPQAVDNDFWRAAAFGAPALGVAAEAATRFLFVGRDAPEKGLGVLRRAWLRAAEKRERIALVLAGGAPAEGPRSVSLGRLDRERLRDVYASCQVLVIPSIATRTFREPWGLVVNEAMNQGLAVIASDAVGAAAGGLVRHGENGLIVPAGDANALGAAIEQLAGDAQLRGELGVRGKQDVQAYNSEAWAEGFSAALATLGLARGHW